MNTLTKGNRKILKGNKPKTFLLAQKPLDIKIKFYFFAWAIFITFRFAKKMNQTIFQDQPSTTKNYISRKCLKKASRIRKLICMEKNSLPACMMTTSFKVNDEKVSEQRGWRLLLHKSNDMIWNKKLSVTVRSSV